MAVPEDPGRIGGRGGEGAQPCEDLGDIGRVDQIAVERLRPTRQGMQVAVAECRQQRPTSQLDDLGGWTAAIDRLPVEGHDPPVADSDGVGPIGVTGATGAAGPDRSGPAARQHEQ